MQLLCYCICFNLKHASQFRYIISKTRKKMCVCLSEVKLLCVIASVCICKFIQNGRFVIYNFNIPNKKLHRNMWPIPIFYIKLHATDRECEVIFSIARVLYWVLYMCVCVWCWLSVFVCKSSKRMAFQSGSSECF